ncbi:MAG: hypothetical protein MI674_00685 [Cytophagales bacterium]|nr:hypothetical protein [Cytophagales bacterium]
MNIRTLILRSLLTLLVLCMHQSTVLAQCAMCRATVENNVSNGETTLATGLNNGIIYLFIAPYLLVAILVLFWYRYSKNSTYLSTKN